MAKKPAKKKANGRPTKYKATYPERVDKYIAKCLKLEEGKERVLPTRADISLLFNVSLVTIDAWVKNHPEFLYALDRVKMSQQSQLVNRCMNGTGNATIGKMLLSANHGMHERTDSNLTGEVGITGLLKALDGQSRGLPK